jgi:hypothetical protein
MEYEMRILNFGRTVNALEHCFSGFNKTAGAKFAAPGASNAFAGGGGGLTRVE